MRDCNTCLHKGNEIKCFMCDDSGSKYVQSKTKKTWQECEDDSHATFKQAIKDLKKTPGSGNRSRGGDMTSSQCYIEVKSTKHNGFRITREMIDSARSEANHRTWVLTIVFVDDSGNKLESISAVDTDLLRHLICKKGLETDEI